MNTGMQRQGNPVPQQAVDVGGCGTQNTGYATGPGPYTQLAQPGQLYAIYFQLGFCGAIDDLGRFYAVSVQRTPEGTPSIWYEDLGPQLAFEIGFGQAEEVRKMVASDGRYELVDTLIDHAEIERVIVARAKR